MHTPEHMHTMEHAHARCMNMTTQNTHTHTCMHACMHKHMHTHAPPHTRARVCACSHTHTRARNSASADVLQTATLSPAGRRAHRVPASSATPSQHHTARPCGRRQGRARNATHRSVDDLTASGPLLVRRWGHSSLVCCKQVTSTRFKISTPKLWQKARVNF